MCEGIVMADESKSENRPLVHPWVKAFLRFFACGPSTKVGGLLWGIAFPDNFSDMDGMPVHHWLP